MATASLPQACLGKTGFWKPGSHHAQPGSRTGTVMPKGRLRHCVCVCVKRFDSKTGAASLLGAAAPSSITQPGCRFSHQRNWGRISGAPWNSKAHKYPRTGQRPLIDKPSRLHSFQRNQITSALLHRTLLPFVCAELVQIRLSTLSFQSENSNVVTFWKICSNHLFFYQKHNWRLIWSLPGQDSALKRDPRKLRSSRLRLHWPSKPTALHRCRGFPLQIQQGNSFVPTGAADPSLIYIQVKDSTDRVKAHVATVTEVRQDHLIKDHSKRRTVMEPTL